MAQIRKYAFDTEFALDGAVLRENPAAAKRLTPDEIAAERTAGYESGKKDALAHAERESAAALRDIAAAASAILTHLESESRALREDAARVAMIAAKKIAGASLDAFGAERAAAAIEAAMETLRHQPRLVVKVSPEAAETLRPRIEEMCKTHAYAGAVLVRVEPGLSKGAVSIDWSDGVVSTDPNDAAERIETLIQTALASAAAATS
jgi:flagellar assembly protein FliH